MGSGVWKRLRVLSPVKVGPGFRKEIKVDVLTGELVVDLDEVKDLRAIILPEQEPKNLALDAVDSRTRAFEALQDLGVCPHCGKKLV